MNNAVNNKRVFLVVPHVPAGYLDIVGRRDDVRLDKLENGNPSTAAKSVLAAAHAYQTSSTRDELVRHYHTGAELLQHTPNLLIVSTNGAGYDTVDVKACTERGILVVNQAGGNAESVRTRAWPAAVALQARGRMRSRAARRHTDRPRRFHPSAMSGAASPNSAAACSAWRSLPTTLTSTPRRRESAARARSNSMNFCAAPISFRSIAR